MNLTVDEQRIYRDGYYTALVYTLRVRDLAIGNYRAVSKTLRAAARAKRMVG